MLFSGGCRNTFFETKKSIRNVVKLVTYVDPFYPYRYFIYFVLFVISASPLSFEICATTTTTI